MGTVWGGQATIQRTRRTRVTPLPKGSSSKKRVSRFFEFGLFCVLWRSPGTTGGSTTPLLPHTRPVTESAGILVSICDPPHLPTRRQAARDGVSQERRKNMGEMAGEARFSREMAAARGLIGDPAQARRDSPDPGRRHDGRGHPAAIFWRRAGRAAAEKSRARLILQ